jgi:hypothetical protein
LLNGIQDGTKAACSFVVHPNGPCNEACAKGSPQQGLCVISTSMG